MGLTLDLPTDLATDLANEASRRGLSLSEYAVNLLAESRPPVPEILSGSELVAYWQREGVVGTRPDILDSSAHARMLREQAQSRG